jgi:hypothetical protein
MGKNAFVIGASFIAAAAPFSQPLILSLSLICLTVNRVGDLETRGRDVRQVGKRSNRIVDSVNLSDRR